MGFSICFDIVRDLWSEATVLGGRCSGRVWPLVVCVSYTGKAQPRNVTVIANLSNMPKCKGTAGLLGPGVRAMSLMPPKRRCGASDNTGPFLGSSWR